MKVKGSVTVFMSIILSALIAFSGVMVDVSRWRMAQKHAKAAVQLSVQSALTQYHAPLKEHYGLMSMGQEKEELEALIFELVENNLAIENGYMPEYVDLYGFCVENVTVTPFFNLSENYVLEQQITQFMKYRAPVNMICDFVEKLKALKTCIAQSGVLKKRMDLEKKLQKIREEQVYLSLLLSGRVHGFSNEEEPAGETKANLEKIKELSVEIQKTEAIGGVLDKAWLAMPEHIQTIKQAQEAIHQHQNAISVLKKGKAPYEDRYDDIQDDMSRVEGKISQERKKINSCIAKSSKEELDEALLKSMENTIDGYRQSISAYENELSYLQSRLSEISRIISQYDQEIAMKNNEINTLKNHIRNERESLCNKVDICLEQLRRIEEKTSTIDFCVLELQRITARYLQYHHEALFLAEEIKNGCEKVKILSEEINAELEEQSKNSNDAFLIRIKADMKKLILNADPDILQKIRSELERNLSHLVTMDHEIKNGFNKMSTLCETLHGFLQKTEKIPEECDYFSREIFGESIIECLQPMKVSIHATTAAYKKPMYFVEPEVNPKEKNEFDRWCNRVFNEDNDVDNNKDKNYQKQLKQNMKKKEEDNQPGDKEYNGEDQNLSDKELEQVFSKLPSFRDKDGNYINVKNSEFIEEKNEDPFLLSNQETREQDIEDRYGNALSQNGGFAVRIGGILENAGDKMIKSLYVNEYIIGAFKNTNMDTVKPPSIRLTGISTHTFYDKAEVEYIIFGAKKEKTNANLVQASIFGIRMGANLIHVYTNSDKSAAALTAANLIAGWTGFGVPIVKNLILLGWAAGESWYDVKSINQGEPVPVYKTKNDWKLNLDSLFSDVAGNIIHESADWLKQEKDSRIEKADGALQDLVQDIIYSAVNEVFLPVEQAITELGYAEDAMEDPTFFGLVMPETLQDISGFKEWVTEAVKKQYESIQAEAMNWTKLQMETYKQKITEKITDFVFESNAYKNLTEAIKGGLNDIIHSGADGITEAVKKLGDEIEDDGTKERLLGSVVSFDYVDYLRLLLLVLPQNTKVFRTADLVQLNMRKTLDNPDFIMSEYHSFLIVEAEISMRYLFLPENIAGKDKGKIKIRWGYGY